MRNYLWVVLVDVVLLAALYYVVGDLSWRVAYASSPHARTSGYTTSFSYSLFTQIFTMSGNGATFASPLTLDWVQVLAVSLFVVNAWFVYVTFADRRKKTADVPGRPPAV